MFYCKIRLDLRFEVSYKKRVPLSIGAHAKMRTSSDVHFLMRKKADFVGAPLSVTANGECILPC